MTNKAESKPNYKVHSTPQGPQPHAWRYLGRVAQAYECLNCELRVTKAELKGATD